MSLDGTFERYVVVFVSHIDTHFTKCCGDVLSLSPYHGYWFL